MVRVKICGITRESDLIAAAESGADAIGLVLGFSKSPRNLSLEAALRLREAAPPFLDVVLVLNGEDKNFVEEACRRLRPEAVQIYGDMDPDDVRGLGVHWVIKPIDPMRCLSIEVDGFDAVLLDSSMGSGKMLDWSKYIEFREGIKLPLIISGGLTPENVQDAIRILKPYGVDVSSGVERSPGVKDPDLVKLFVKHAKEVIK